MYLMQDVLNSLLREDGDFVDDVFGVVFVQFVTTVTSIVSVHWSTGCSFSVHSCSF